MPDGSIQYRQLNVSNNKELEFKDEGGNVLLDEKDVAWIYEKYSEDSGYHLILEFTVDATTELAEATKENIGKEISLFADGEKVFFGYGCSRNFRRKNCYYRKSIKL